MKLPTFKPSKLFLGEFELPCLVAKIKNSKLPGIAARHIAETKDDPTCEIYLRGKDPKKISAWQQKFLDQLFVKEGLAGVVEEALEEYGKRRDAYISAKEKEDISKCGFAPFIRLSTVVIDEVAQEVFLSGGSNWTVDIPEHGLDIYRRDDRWRRDESQDFSRYQSGLEEEVDGPKTLEDLEKDQEEEINNMMGELAGAMGRAETMVARYKEQKKRWDEMFPATEPAVKTDASFLCGEWKLDWGQTEQLQKRLGIELDLGEDEMDEEANPDERDELKFHITLQSIKQIIGEVVFRTMPIKECTRRGNRFTINESKGVPGDYWCDGKTLVDITGQVYRRAG